MSPSQPAPGPEEQILLTVADQSKLDLVMELLSHFDLVQARRVRVGEPASVSLEKEAADLTPKQKAEQFLQLAGVWKDRDVDAAELRERAWRRGNSGN